MIVTSGNCPSCGAQIAFKLGSSIVVVCEYCGTVVARKDRSLADLGKVADLIDTRSPLAIGRTGYFEGAPFTLVGRAQMRHPAGGVWDEWYAAFEDGRWGWLAEAQGHFYMTFRRRLRNPKLLPRHDDALPGSSVVLPGDRGRYVVAERTAATTEGARGEIPYELVPGERFEYADLSGDGGAFATIDFGEEPPALYIGRQVTLKELRIFDAEGDEFDADRRRVDIARLACPRCNGPLVLRAPDAALRVTCPNCNSLLDVDGSELRYLRALSQGPPPEIPLGCVGKLPDGAMTVVGYLVRDCVVEGTTYPWDEYLLYTPQIGFRWLVRSDDHWTYVRPLDAGAVFDGGTSVSYQGSQYTCFNKVVARVRRVYGEFYWRVEEHETVAAVDYVRPPEMISKEASGHEVNWSLGTYLPRAEVEAAFKLKRPLREPSNIAPCQPNPHQVPWAAALLLVCVAVAILFVHTVFIARRPVLAKAFAFPALPSVDGTQVLFSDPFELASWRNVRIEAAAPVDNSWLYVEGDLVNDETGLVQNFALPVEYYHGVDGGESWSEGGKDSEVFLSALPGGRYVLRLEAQWGGDGVPGRPGHWQTPATVKISVEQGVPRLIYFAVVLVLVVVPVLVRALVRHAFERKRWSQSMFNPYESS